ncbi:MAG: ABC transporter permease, partial [Acidobacteriota bacterium]
MRREPLQIFAIMITLAVGLGASTAIFAFLDHIWLVPLPYSDADRIVRVWESLPQDPKDVALGLSHPHYLTLLQGSQSLESVALYTVGESEVSLRDETVKVQLARVTPRFFPLLGVPPGEGRWLCAELSQSPRREAVVSRQLWRRLFGESELDGQSLRIHETEHPVVGIMPGRFAFPAAATQVWAPMPPPPPEEAENRYALSLAKRREDVSSLQVAAEVGRFFDRSNVRVVDLWDDLYGSLRRPLQWLGGGIAAVLLIALLNAATLQFARFSRRWKDFAIRAALGAKTAQLAVELVLESLLLTAVGALLGFTVFSAFFTFVTQNWPGEIPGIHDFSMWAPRPLLVLGGEILLSAFALGGLAVWFVRRLHVLGRLNPGQDAAPLASFRLRLNSLTVSAQLAASVVLVICAGMLTRSFIDAVTVDLGYEPQGLLAAHFQLPSNRYPTRDLQAQAIDAIAERLQAVDGVVTVAFSSTLPSVSRGSMTVQFPAQPELAPQVGYSQVTPGFFRALGLRLVQGRLLQERPTSVMTLVVNQSFANAYLGPQPIGTKVLLGPGRVYEVAGLVSDALQDGYLSRPEPWLYFHYLQPPSKSFLHDLDREFLTLRLEGEPLRYSAAVSDLVKSFDAEIRLDWIRPMSEILAEQFAQPRFWTVLAMCLSLLALLFSMVALYAMMSYSVSQRIPELAVRMTLGASPGEIHRLVMKDAFAMIGKGLLAGVLLSLLVTVLFADLLFGAARLPALT